MQGTLQWRVVPDAARRVAQRLARCCSACAGATLTAALGLTGTAFAAPPITVAAFPAVDEIVRAAIPEWKKIHPDINVIVVSRQIFDHHSAMTTALSTASHLPDVMTLEIGYLGRFSQGGGLEDLAAEKYGMRRYQSLYVPYSIAQATSRSGAITAAPSDIGPGTLLYRTDLLARAGVTEAELNASWDSFVDAGIKIKKATGAYLVSHVQDLKEIVIRTGIKPGEGLYYDAQSNVLVKSPRFVRAFQLAKKVRQYKLDARSAQWSTEWSESFKRGTLATQMSGAWMAGHLENWLAPKTAGLWRAAQLPEHGWAAFGGTFFAIPKGIPDQQKTSAWEFIKFLTQNPAMQIAAFKNQNAFPALLSTYNDPFFEQPIAFLGDQQARRVWREAAEHIQAVAIHKQDKFAEEVINTELDKVLDQGKDINLALDDAYRLLEKRAFR